jgi:myo-inositol 2-dehydrogenase/D-chiro-inositol 1-dehydrogenase
MTMSAAAEPRIRCAGPRPRVGLIGTGFMGSVHSAAWRAIGIPPSAILVRGRHGGAAGAPVDEGIDTFTDLETFLRHVDVVDICTPSDTHADFALAAARAGKPTLCEKPLSLDVAESLRIVAAFSRAGVPLQVAHVVRFSPEHIAAREAVCRGDVGDPAVIRLSRLSFAPDRGAGSWFADERRSGGLFFDLMIHDLDYARWIAGDVTQVYARASGGARGHGIALLTHASGAISHVEASWAEPAPVFRTRVEIAGSRAVIGFDSDETAPITARLHRAVAEASTALGNIDLAANPFEGELHHFLDVLEGRREPVLTALDAAAAVQLATAARESARDGVAVSISPLGGEV